MNKATKQQTKIAKEIIENHEHDENCMEVEFIEVTYFSNPDTDASYERPIYVCKVTGKDIPLEIADPQQDMASDEQ